MGNVSKITSFKWEENVFSINEKLKKFIKSIKTYDEESNIGYIFEADVEYPRNLYDFHNGLPFLPERMKILKCSKLLCNLYDKKNYVVRLKALKQALNHGLTVKKVHRLIQFNEKTWLITYIDMDTK